MKKTKKHYSFSLDDIHRIRQEHYEKTKNMTFTEYKKDLKKGVEVFHKALLKIK
jgi:hypothetical protein